MFIGSSTNIISFDSVCPESSGYLSCGLDLARRGLVVANQLGEQYVGAQLAHAIITTTGTTILSWIGQYANFFSGRRILSKQLALVESYKVNAIKASLDGALSIVKGEEMATVPGKLLKQAISKVLIEKIQEAGHQKLGEKAIQVAKSAEEEIKKEKNAQLQEQTAGSARREIENLEKAFKERIKEAKQGGVRAADDELSVAQQLLKQTKELVNPKQPSLKRAAAHGLFAGGVVYGAEAAAAANWTDAIEFASPLTSTVDSLIESVTNRAEIRKQISDKRNDLLFEMKFAIEVAKELKKSFANEQSEPLKKSVEALLKWEADGGLESFDQLTPGEVLDMLERMKSVRKLMVEYYKKIPKFQMNVLALSSGYEL